MQQPKLPALTSMPVADSCNGAGSAVAPCHQERVAAGLSQGLQVVAQAALKLHITTSHTRLNLHKHTTYVCVYGCVHRNPAASEGPESAACTLKGKRK